MKSKLSLFFILLLSLVYFPSVGAVPDRLSAAGCPAVSEDYLSFRHLTTEDGLSHLKIQAACEDNKGNILIGTRYGVNKYNGHDFKYYFNNRGDSLSLNGANIWRIFSDSRMRVWVGTTDGGADFYDASEDRFIPLTHGISVLDIIEDSSGEIWMAGQKSGLLLVEEVPEVRFFKPSSAIDGSDISISALCEIDERFLLIGTKKNGLYLFDRQSMEFTEVLQKPSDLPVSMMDIFDITIFDGYFYFSTDRGLFRSPVSGFKQSGLMSVSRFYPSVIDFQVNRSVVFDDQLWCATDNGLVCFRPQGDGDFSYSVYRHDPHDLNSLVSDNINDVYFDRSGIMWVATSMGLSYCPLWAVQIRNFIHPEINDISQNVVLQDSRDRIWQGLQNGKICCYDYNRDSFRSYEVDRSSVGSIDCMVEDPWGYLWVGRWGNGLYRIFIADDRFVPEQVSIPHTGYVTSLEFFGDDLYVGTYGFGVKVVSFSGRGKVASVKDLSDILGPEKKLLSTTINYLYADPIENCLWISTPNGLNCFSSGEDGLSLSAYTKKGGAGTLSDNYVWEVLRTSASDLWVATIYDGLDRLVFDPVTGAQTGLQVYRTSDGLATNSVQTLEYDSVNDGLWIGTCNLSFLDIKKNKIINFGASDGVRGSFIRVNSSTTLSDGTLCFGTNNGLNIIRPRPFSRDWNVPSLEFGNLFINGKKIGVGDQLSPHSRLEQPINDCSGLDLSYDKRNIALQVTAVNFSNPEECSIRYRMDGKNDNWIELRASQINLNFDDLNYGDFTLNVQAANRGGVWSDSKILGIRILRPWWISWWAYLIYIFVGASIAAGIFYFFRQRQKFRQQLFLEKIKTEKHEELAMAKINFFTNISHDLLTPLTLISDPLENIIKNNKDRSLDYYLDLMHRNTEKLMSTIRQLLDFRKVETGNYSLRTEECDLVSVFKNIASSFSYSVSMRNIKYDYSSNYDHYKTWIDKDCIERIMFNLLSNSLKYTGEGYIGTELEIIPSRSIFRIIVSDSGYGISDSDRDKIFESFYRSDHDMKRGSGIGLPLVKDLVAMHYGRIEFTSKVGEGTSFIVTIPLGDSYMKPQEKLVVAKGPGESEEDADLIQHETDYGKNSILIAEDNEELLEYLVNELKNNYIIYYAKDGSDAYEQAVKYLPNLVLSDVMMPGIDGFELCSRLKSKTSTKHIPIILLTAKVSESDHNSGIEKGADLYLTKPFKLSILKNYIKNLIHHANSMKLYYSAQKVGNEDVEQNDFLEQTSSVMRAHLDDESFCSKHFAQELNISYSTLYNRLKEFTGLSVTQYMRQFRLNEAARLLANTPRTVNEIIYSVGFSDPKYFRECFKKQYGITPSEYIRKYRMLQ